MKENLAAVLSGKAKASTKALFALLLALPGIVQIPMVKNFLSGVYTAHPKIATTVGALVAIGTLLHNPKVQAILGMEIPEGANVSLTQTTAVDIQQDNKEK